MGDSCRQAETLATLLRIKQVKLDAAERRLAREQDRLTEMDRSADALRSRQATLAAERAALMTGLEGELTFDDLCHHQARLLRAGRDLQALQAEIVKLNKRRASQKDRCETARKLMAQLRRQWEKLKEANSM